MGTLSNMQHALREEKERHVRRMAEAQRYQQEAALEASGVNELARESVRLQRELDNKTWETYTKSERKRLVLEASSDWASPKYTPSSDLSEVVTQKCFAAWDTFIKSGGLKNAIVTEEYLKLFLQQNTDADLTNPETFRSAIAYVTSKLTRPTPPEPAQLTQPRDAAGRFVAEVVEDDGNPHQPGSLAHSRYYSTEEYRAYERDKLNQDRLSETIPAFRSPLQEIAEATGLAIPEACAKEVHDLVTRGDRRFSSTRAGIRRAFFFLYSNQIKDDSIYEGDEKGVMLVDTAPESLSAGDFAAYVGRPNPQFRGTGLAPTRNLGVR